MPVSSLSLHTTWDWDNELWEPNIRASWDERCRFYPLADSSRERRLPPAAGEASGVVASFGNSAADPAAYPTSVAGTFGATDGTRSVAGSFGAHGQ